MLETKAFKEVNAPVKYLNGERWTELKVNARTKYLISTKGRIYSYTRDRILQGCMRNGIACLIFTPKNQKDTYTHAYTGKLRRVNDRQQMVMTFPQLMGMTFLVKPKGHTIVVHMNYDKGDNSLDNLKWMKMDRSWDRSRDSPKYFRTRRLVKLTPEKVLKIKSMLQAIRKGKLKMTIDEIAKQYDVASIQIYRIQNGDLWKDVGPVIKKKVVVVNIPDRRIREIRQALKTQKGVDVARQFNLTTTTVSRIKRRRYYNHVKD